MAKPKVIATANQKGGIFLAMANEMKSRHEPNGKAAEAYRTLVQEVMEIGEKQRSRSAVLGR